MTMQIRSIRIESFASIRQMEIVGLEAGLNIVVGDNEAGKSTVLTALRAAFLAAVLRFDESAAAALA